MMLASFLIGGVGYPVIELLYRRRTHPAMALAGGMSLCALTALHRRNRRRPLWRTALLGGLAVTSIEYALGKCVNRRYQIWDYRHTPLNYQGQICAPFFLAWCGLSAAAIMAMRRLRL